VKRAFQGVPPSSSNILSYTYAGGYEMELNSFGEVTCDDCRFLGEEEEHGESVYLCLAKARRRIDPREKKTCRRFFKKSDDEEKDLFEYRDLKGDRSNYFDLAPLYSLVSGGFGKVT